MSLDIKVKAGSIESVMCAGGYRSNKIEVEMSDVELSECVPVDEIVGEYDHDDLLSAIGDDKVARWLENQGFTVNEE